MTKKRVNILVEEKILKQWDRLRKSIGLSRTALIHNSIRIYEMFINNQLNGDKTEAITQQLDQIENLIEGLTERRNLLLKENENIEQAFSDKGPNIEDFEVISKKVLDLLKSWGSLPEVTISNHLNYPNWIIWTVLKKLKTMKKVKVSRGEWSLYENP